MKKINIAELLKDCPRGMELDCPMYENIYFDYISNNKIYPICCYTEDNLKAKHPITFTWYGRPSQHDSAKCVIFPKGKTTWEGFQRPFKDGDIVVTTLDNIAIIRKPIGKELSYVHGIMTGNGFYKVETAKVFVKRLATEEEKQKLFQAIKNNGYYWNAETKTLEKLVIKPKFKAGDKVKRKDVDYTYIVTIAKLDDDYYDYVNEDGQCGVIHISAQDDWELVPNKFDVTTLKPFDKVLVRSHNSDIWECDFFSLYNPECSNRFHCIGAWYDICIPYIGNEHLRGTANDCNEYYKTWE